jgi:hypothetical protein
LFLDDIPQVFFGQGLESTLISRASAIASGSTGNEPFQNDSRTSPASSDASRTMVSIWFSDVLPVPPEGPRSLTAATRTDAAIFCPPHHNE